MLQLQEDGSWRQKEVPDETETLLWFLRTNKKDHSGRNCPRRRICCVCKENHSTGPHGYKPRHKESVARGIQSSEEKSTNSGRKIACASTTIQEDAISMCVVLLKIKHKDSSFVYSTIAMLDNCSQGYFVKVSLMKTLQSRGQKTSVTAKT